MSRRKSFINSGLDDVDILDYAKRINMGRLSETITYDKDHVPKLKPKYNNVSLPSPMVLARKHHTYKVEFDSIILEEVINE